MPDFKVVLSRSAIKELEELDNIRVNYIFPKIKSLGENPQPKGCLKLRGETNLWRIRIRDYRVIYSIDRKNKIVDVVLIKHRKDAYR